VLPHRSPVRLHRVAARFQRVSDLRRKLLRITLCPGKALDFANKLIALSQVRPNADNHLQLVDRRPERLASGAQRVGSFLCAIRILAGVFVRIARQQVRPRRPLRRLESRQRLIKLLRLDARLGKQLPGLIVDLLDPANHGAQPAARLDDQPPDVPIGVQEIVPAAAQRLVVEAEKGLEPFSVNRAERRRRQQRIVASGALLVEQRPAVPFAPAKRHDFAVGQPHRRTDPNARIAKGLSTGRPARDSEEEVSDSFEARALPRLVEPINDGQAGMLGNREQPLGIAAVFFEAQFSQPHGPPR
jgi:hypothetical protein